MIASTWSLQTKLVLIVLGTAVLPLAVAGVLLANSISRSGEALLRSRLEQSLGAVARGIGSRWVGWRADILNIAEDPAVRAVLRDPRIGSDVRAVDLAVSTTRLQDAAESVLLRPVNDSYSWSIISRQAGDAAFSASFDVFDGPLGVRIGYLDARIRLNSLVPTNAAWTAGAGAVLAVFDRTTGASLLPLPFDAQLTDEDRFEWAGEQWIVTRYRLEEPAIELVAAAPVLGFAQPFSSAARQGLVALGVVAMMATILTIVLTRETTKSISSLSEAADTIARGQYGATVEARGGNEVGRLARAFNTMSLSLRRTIDQLAERQALAAVGEFAAMLAHEVRNPLTAIRIDLQRLEEKAGEDSSVRESAARALRTVSRLDATVTGALRVARSGQARLEPHDIHIPLLSAMHDASAEMAARGIELRDRSGAEPLIVSGDSAALHQLFLNLLLNAAQATAASGHVEVSVVCGTQTIDVRISDTGPGIPPAARDLVFAPLYSNKTGGTGLGLAIARRIAIAHGGTLTIEDGTPGAVLVVSLPIAQT